MPSGSGGGVKDRVALVTGASRGIGLVTAQLLAERGAIVVGVARSNISQPIFALTIVADLSTETECRQTVETILETFGRIDVLVCNHGIGTAHERPLYETTVESYHQSMQTNIDGPFYLTRYVMPSMVQQNYGRFVYVASTAAITVDPEPGVGYNTSKAALCGLMRSVAQDGGPYHITSNAVCPGWVRTELAERSAIAEAKQRGNDTTSEDIWNERAALYPAKRVVTPLEVAHAILFLASEESSGISGESIRVSLGCPW
jgi:NAD(P)-dependent dehydrogenase (short-subunit alcohol dehydrogenase family)